MPCQWVIANDGTLVVERWTGSVTQDELMAHKMQQARDPSIKAGASVLSDCTGAVFSISLEAIGELSAMENDPERETKIRRFAFLVNNDIYSKAQQFADRVSNSGKRVIIFNSPDVACIWLGIDKAQWRKLMDNMGD